MTKKKYIILFIIITILLIIGLGLVGGNKKEEVQENTENFSGNYKISEDMMTLSMPRTENLKIERLILSSPDFLNLESIPSEYTCDGENINPNLEISGVNVEKAKSLVLIMDDPDASDGVWDHWIKFNISAETRNINAGEIIEGIAGEGTGGNLEYTGPCPPEGKHNYIFKLYVLDIELTLPEGSSKAEVEEAMMGHTVQSAELVGVYERVVDLVGEKEDEEEPTVEE